MSETRLLLWIPIAFILALGCSTKPDPGSPVYYTPSAKQAPRSIITAAQDTMILTRIKTKIFSDDLADQGEMDISVRHGVVFLEGKARDDHHRRMVTDLIRTVEGVVRIENRLQVIHQGTIFETPETLVQDQIKMALIQDQDLSLSPIVVQATPTQVVLSGNVASQPQKQKAASIASKSAGDRQVINRIEVRY